MTDMIIIHCTTASMSDAEIIAATLLKEKAAACVQIAEIKSRFVWEGRAVGEDEQLLLIKTRKDLFEKVRGIIHALHAYETPEIVAVDVTAGDPDYLAWIADVTA